MAKSNPIAVACLAIVCAILTGCTRPEAYYEAFHEQQKTLREVTSILADIEDEKSLKAAEAKLDDRREEFEARAHKAQSLPSPPPAEVMDRLRDERAALQNILEDYQYQVRRVRGLKLKGTDAFFEHFKTTQAGLLSAVKQ